MKRVHPSKLPYRIREDVRHEPVRVGKYIYLALLISLFIFMFHLLFGHLYLLRGEGFVFSDNIAMSIEQDVRIVDVKVREGDLVSKGDLLFQYDSLALRSKMVDQSLRLVELANLLDEKRLHHAQTLAELSEANKYASYTKGVDDALKLLNTRGLASNIERSSKAERSYEAAIWVARYEGELKKLEVAVKNLEKNLQQAEQHYQDLLKIFNQGEFRAPAAGIVTSVLVVPGSVLKNGDIALRLFHGERYVYTYFDERSMVSYQKGDKVWIDLANEGWMHGEISELLPISERLPDEFQPRFKPTQRSQLAKISIAPEVLQRASINTTVSVRKLPFVN